MNVPSIFSSRILDLFHRSSSQLDCHFLNMDSTPKSPGFLQVFKFQMPFLKNAGQLFCCFELRLFVTLKLD